MRQRDWGESSILFLCVLLFSGLNNRYTLGPPALTLALGIVVAVMFLLSLYWTVTGERKQTRLIMSITAVVLAVGVALSLSKVVYLTIYQAKTIDPIRLIESSLLIWIANVVVFATLYHLLGEREFAFPRTESQAGPAPMCFLDYMFLSFTTATAFSPTDTSPLTTRARMLMMGESIISLMTIAIAAARAINILPSA